MKTVPTNLRFAAALVRATRWSLWITAMGVSAMPIACGGLPTPATPTANAPMFSPAPPQADTPSVPETAVPGPTTPVPATASATATATPNPVTVTLTPRKDNTLYENDPGLRSNGSGQHFFVGKSAIGSVRRAVIAFPIAEGVPPGSSITRVSLTLNLSRTQNEEQAVALHRMLADWGEGTSDAGGNEGSGAPAGPGDATWTYRSFDVEPWTQPGGDFRPSASGEATLSGPGRYSWQSTGAMVDDVQMWLDHSDSNFGWLLRGDEEGPRTTKRFDSRENQSLEDRPRLTVTFVPRPGP